MCTCLLRKPINCWNIVSIFAIFRERKVTKSKWLQHEPNLIKRCLTFIKTSFYSRVSWWLITDRMNGANFKEEGLYRSLSPPPKPPATPACYTSNSRRVQRRSVTQGRWRACDFRQMSLGAPVTALRQSRISDGMEALQS